MKENDKLAYKPFQKLSQRYLKGAVYGILLILTNILQSLPHFPPSIGGSRPLLMIPVVVCIAMFEGPVIGGVVGAAGGFLWDLFADRLLGFNALILLAICCACGLLSQFLIRNNLLSCMLMVGIALFLQGIFDWFFNYVISSQEHPFYVLFHMTIPNMIYSIILTPILYGMVYSTVKFLRNHEAKAK